MFAIRDPAVLNLWFDFDACAWTLDLTKRTTFATRDEAAQWATLPQGGGMVIEVA